MESRRNGEKPTVDRKGAEDMAPTGEVAFQIPRKVESRGVASWLEKALQLAVEAEQEASPHESKSKSEFEARLIQKCLEDGMNESEILEWMREI